MFKKALIIGMICLSVGSIGLARGRTTVVGKTAPVTFSK